MADPKLTIVIEQKGADGVVKSLKEIEKVGNTTFTRITKDGKLVSETMKTMTGAAKTNWQQITALSSAYTAWNLAIGQVTRTIGSFLQAAREDEASVVRRNAALEQSIGFTQDLTKALDAQADAYSRAFGISDDYTREIQTQWAANGANADSVERLTQLSINMAEIMKTDASTAVVRLTNFLNGNTDALKGTILRAKDGEDVMTRLARAEEYAATGADMLREKMETGQGASDRYKTATDELRESIGRLGETDPVISGIDAITRSLQNLTDWIDGNAGTLTNFMGLLGSSLGGFTGMITGMNVADNIEGTKGGAIGAALGGIVASTGNVKFKKLGDTGGGGRKTAKRPPTGPQFEFGIFADAVDFIQKKLMERHQEGMALGALLAAGSANGQGSSWNNMFTASGTFGSIDSAQLRAGIKYGDLYSPLPVLQRMLGGRQNWDDMTPAEKAQAARDNQPKTFNPDNMTSIIMSVLGGDFRGAGSQAGSILGENAFGKMGGLLGSLGGPLGGLVGGWLGGGLGKLFGGGHKKRQGETPGQPVYVEDVRMNNQLTDFLNSTKLLMLRGAGQGIDNGVRQIGLQNARAGM